MQQTVPRERPTSEATSGSRARVLSTSALAFETKYTIASRTSGSKARVCLMCCSVLVFVSFEVALGPVSENAVLSPTPTTDIGAVDGHYSSTI